MEPGDLKEGEKDKQERDEAALAGARQQVFDVFDALGIPYEVASHPPINSAFDRERQGIVVNALICKNLFLRNKDKSRHYLFTLPIDKRADLLALQKALGETRLSFGDAEALWELLRIRPGSVSLLNIIGAWSVPGGSPGETSADSVRALKFLVDAETLREPRIGVHPNDNAATIMFAPGRLPELFRHYGADFEFVDLPHCPSGAIGE